MLLACHARAHGPTASKSTLRVANVELAEAVRMALLHLIQPYRGIAVFVAHCSRSGGWSLSTSDLVRSAMGVWKWRRVRGTERGARHLYYRLVSLRSSIGFDHAGP